MVLAQFFPDLIINLVLGFFMNKCLNYGAELEDVLSELYLGLMILSHFRHLQDR